MRLKLISLVLSITTLLFVSSSPAFAFDLFSSACSGKSATSSTCTSAANPGGNGNTANPIVNVINNAATIIALITGIAAVIVMILGGITMITSAGNTEAVAAARRRVIYAAIGLAIVASSWTIIRFITDKVIS